MHIILALLGTIVTILILLNRLNESGIDLGWLNPFSWARRRKFRNEHDLNPVFKLDSPMEAAAILMLASAKIDGDITREQKALLLTLFAHKFHQSEQDAKSLLNASTHLLGRGEEVFNSPEKVLQRSLDNFTTEQAQSVLDMLDEIINNDGTPSKQQVDFVAKVKQTFPSMKDPQQWS